jgi:hypothetical protein
MQCFCRFICRLQNRSDGKSLKDATDNAIRYPLESRGHAFPSPLVEMKSVIILCNYCWYFGGVALTTGKETPHLAEGKGLIKERVARHWLPMLNK